MKKEAKKPYLQESDIVDRIFDETDVDKHVNDQEKMKMKAVNHFSNIKNLLRLLSMVHLLE